MRKKLFTFLLVAFALLVSSELVTSTFATTETRYMRSDEVLGTTQTLSSDNRLLNSYEGNVQVDQSLSIRVWHNNTEITSGTIVAKATGKTTGLKSATWDCPQTTLNNELISIKVYKNDSTESPTFVVTFNTTVLAGNQLDGVQWAVYYYLLRLYAGGMATYRFYYGRSTYDSKITNFQYSTVSGETTKNLYGTITLKFTIGSLRAWSMTRTSLINPKFSIGSSLSSLKLLNFAGAIIQTFLIDMTKTITFNIQSTISPLFTINSGAKIASTFLTFYGSIEVLFEIASNTVTTSVSDNFLLTVFFLCLLTIPFLLLYFARQHRTS